MDICTVSDALLAFQIGAVALQLWWSIPLVVKMRRDTKKWKVQDAELGKLHEEMRRRATIITAIQNAILMGNRNLAEGLLKQYEEREAAQADAAAATAIDKAKR